MWRMVAGGKRPWEPPHPVRVEQRSYAVVAGADDPLPSASQLGKGRFPEQLLEVVDQCLRLRETERIQDASELLEMLRAANDRSLSAVPAEAGSPQSEGTAPLQEGSGTSIAPAAKVSRGVTRRVGKLVVAGLAVGLGLALATWWSLDSPSTNSPDMEFVWIPAGEFLMGSPSYSNERQHEVRISQGFWMGKYEVTQGEWEAVMGSNPSFFDQCGSRCPVETVSWFDVLGYIRRLNERESRKGYRYRLPTEAEWEYAARAGTTGAQYGELNEIAWYIGNSGRTTHPVGQKVPNAWGLHDILGNVWEWTGDRYGEYPAGKVTDSGGPSMGSRRVFRGGSWSNYAVGVRSAIRSHNLPGYRNGTRGFRLVRTE